MLDSIPLIAQAAIAILIGFVGLIWSADRFVGGSAAIAKSFGVTPLIIGLTIVSFGTSAPEIVVSINAALEKAGDLAVGNAIGSNIANIGLVLGATTLVAAIPVQKHLMRHEMPILLGITLVAGFLLFDAKISFWEGALYISALIPLMFYLVKVKQKDLSPSEIAEEESEIPDMSRQWAFFWFIVGLIVLIASSDALVWGAKITAEHFGVSPLIIGLTVVAIGTSLPELAASIMSAIKGHHDIALGNIIGSNMFNLLAVMSIPALINPPEMESSVFERDYMVMMGMTVLLGIAIAVSLFVKRAPAESNETTSSAEGKLGKLVGCLLLCSYVGYYVYLFSGQ